MSSVAANFHSFNPQSNTSTPSSPSVLPFHRRQLPQTPILTSQLPIPSATYNQSTYSPLSSGLPSPNFSSPIPLPSVAPPLPLASRHVSRQQSVRRLSSISGFPSRNPTMIIPRTPNVEDDYAITEDVLSEGDIIGDGDLLHGESIYPVSIPTSAPRPEQAPPTDHFQVVRKLGAGSYAVVYLVQEILSAERIERTHEEMGMLEEEEYAEYEYTYGRDFAVKCLSKASLSPEELEIQMFEAKLHQSLPTHPNIVTLYRTLQTPSYLLLILESVPGQDLFYFLEQARDSERTPSRPLPPVPTDNALMISNTPTTPSLLSTSNPQHLLSYQRLKLITSMFGQMCDAVDACHTQGLSHRDIKPENFIVTEGRTIHGSLERKVLVKLSDFGLATTLQESSDVDCGSAPYMSYECRNNVGPTYSTQPADVWSLGIVLINMLYHHNPWSDTATLATSAAEHHRTLSNSSKSPTTLPHLQSSPPTASQTYLCPAFASYMADPVQFFLRRFPGMTYPVADFFANRVFCILPNLSMHGGSIRNRGNRVTAREFGEWIKALPALLAAAEYQRPSFARSKLGLTAESDEDKYVEDEDDEDDDENHRSRKPKRVLPEEKKKKLQLPPPPGMLSMSDVRLVESGTGPPSSDELRSPSAKRRGKRGARRKDKSQPPSTANPSTTSLLEMSTTMDLDVLAAEVEKSARSRSIRKINQAERALARMPPMPRMPPPPPPPSSGLLTNDLLVRRKVNESSLSVVSVPSSVVSAPPSFPSPISPVPPVPVLKKSWMDRLRLGNSSFSSTHASPAALESPATIPASTPIVSSSNNAPSNPVSVPVRRPLGSQWVSGEEESKVAANLEMRSRRLPGAQWVSGEDDLKTTDNLESRGRSPPSHLVPPPSSFPKPVVPELSTSPNRQRAMDANWRSSFLSTGTQSSASSTFTKFDNASLRSVSTMATSVSAASRLEAPNWRASQMKKEAVAAAEKEKDVDNAPAPTLPHDDSLGPPRPRRKKSAPPNVKKVDGIASVVGSYQPRFTDGVLPSKDGKSDNRVSKKSHPLSRPTHPLDSISERNQTPPSSPEQHSLPPIAESPPPLPTPPQPPKTVHKSQSHVFKMFSSLKK